MHKQSKWNYSPCLCGNPCGGFESLNPQVRMLQMYVEMYVRCLKSMSLDLQHQYWMYLCIEEGLDECGWKLQQEGSIEIESFNG